MQMRVNLSIQLPRDKSSLLPVHSDVWSGDSPFETVVWLPLVDCFKTKSMFILPPAKYNKIKKIFQEKNIILVIKFMKKLKKILFGSILNMAKYLYLINVYHMEIQSIMKMKQDGH